MWCKRSASGLAVTADQAQADPLDPAARDGLRRFLSLLNSVACGQPNRSESECCRCLCVFLSKATTPNWPQRTPRTPGPLFWSADGHDENAVRHELRDLRGCNDSGRVAGMVPSLRSGFPRLPANLWNCRQRHRLFVYVAGSMCSIGVGPRGSVPDQSVLCARKCRAAIQRPWPRMQSI